VGGALLVGPDNGLLVPAAESLGGIAGAVSLTNADYHVQPVSSTFHGRDVFAPAAAYLATGLDLARLGKTLDPSSLVRVELPGTKREGANTIAAIIIAIDRYGNARLSVMQEESGLEYGVELKIDAGDGEMPVRYLETFGSANAGELVIVPDSHWRLSLAINKGNAAQALGLKVGGRVRMMTPPAGGSKDEGA
jgi:S-adenosylmethionine hydrolase